MVTSKIHSSTHYSFLRFIDGTANNNPPNKNFRCQIKRSSSTNWGSPWQETLKDAVTRIPKTKCGLWTKKHHATLKKIKNALIGAR